MRKGRNGMRIAFVYRNFSRAGSLERDSVFLVEGLARRGVEMHCYCDPNTRHVNLPGVAFHDVEAAVRSRSRFGYPLERGTFAARATRALRRDRDRYDLIHVFGVSAWEHDVVSVPAVMAADQRRWPKEGGVGYRVARARAALAPVLRPEVAVVRTVERLQFRRGHFARAITVTESVRDDLVAVHGVPPELIDVVPPPIEVARFAGAKDGNVRTGLGLAAETNILLFVGHQFERKGLSDAVAALAGTSPNAHLVVVGHGDRESYREQAKRLSVSGRLHFVGPTAEPEHFYAAADVLVLPTRHDPWGTPVIEAMAAGIPVVTTTAAGSAGVAEKAGAAVLVPQRSPMALAAALRDLLADPSRRRELGERGRAAAGPFDVEAHVDSMLETYARALAARGRA